jgi:hypothetical protein
MPSHLETAAGAARASLQREELVLSAMFASLIFLQRFPCPCLLSTGVRIISFCIRLSAAHMSPLKNISSLFTYYCLLLHPISRRCQNSSDLTGRPQF